MGIKNLFLVLLNISLSNSAISEPDNKKPSGLTLKLIHRDSIESNNLTHIEKFRKTIHRSKLRANHLTSSTWVTQGKLGPSLTYELSSYVVELNVGTPPTENVQYLILDTAVELTWLQCDGCIDCYKQKQHLYNPHKSDTYELLPCDHPLCKPYECNHNHCKFKEWDSPDVHVEGFMGKDSFGFPISDTNYTVVDGVVFGCGYGTVGFGFEADPDNSINGVFGLGPGRRSFLSQFVPQGLFSYCSADWHFGPPDYPGHFLFGDDAILPVSGHVRTTPIIEEDPRNYFLKLMDIRNFGSTNETLGFEPGKFDRVHDVDGSHGGFIIDSGTSISYFSSDVYDRLRQEFVDYMKNLGLPEMDAPSHHLDLCWEMPNGLPEELPSMILYFQDHEYEDQKAEMSNSSMCIAHVALLVEEKENPHLCLGIMGNNGTVDPNLNILGAKQQTGNKFSFDITNKTVSWMTWDCELPPPSPPSN